MSYCRFSSDDFKSDVYVYEDITGGWTIHVASSRIIGDIPKIPKLTEISTDDFMKTYKKQMKFLKTAKRKKIELKYDGETFNTESPIDCAIQLIKIKEEGYHIPNGVIDTLINEDMPKINQGEPECQ
jgi:hypothetical protein